MKILLIEPYAERNKVRKLIPVGIPYLAAMLLKAGHEVEGLNANFLDMSVPDSINHIVQTVREGDFDVVGMGGLCMSMTYQVDVFKSLGKLKNRPTLVAGGNMFSSEPEFCMQEFGVDYGIFGEGEIATLKLLDFLENGGEISKISGLYYRDGDIIRSTKIPGEVIDDLDSLPFPAYELFYSDDIIQNQASPSVYTSRSCPFNCSFCYHPVGSKYRRRSVENVIAEIQYMYDRYGTTTYFLGDELFLVEKEWVLSFCDELEKLPFLRHWICQTRASHVDPVLLKRLKEAGCKHVRVGLESGSNTVLRSMNKKTTRADNVRAVKNIRAAGIMMDGGIIMGDFAETAETMQETVDFVKEVNLVPNQGINFVTPFPGSDIWERCLREGLITDKRAYLEALTKPLKLRVNMTRMSEEDLLGLQEWAATEIFTHLATNRRAVVKKVLETNETLSRLKVRCPSCGREQEQRVSGFRLEILHYCEECLNPLHFNLLDVPHLKSRSKRFRETVGKISEDGPRDILVTPSCLDFIRLGIICTIPTSRILAFLDKSGPKTDNDYFGIQVLPRERDLAAKLGAKQLIVVSADHCDEIYQEVAKWNIPGLEIIPLYE